MPVREDTTPAAAVRNGFESAVAAHLAEAVVVVRPRDGSILYANAICERVFGHRPADLTGRHASCLSAASEGTPGRRVGEIAAAVAAKRIWTGDVECRRSDGSRVWTSVRVSGLDHPVHGPVWVCVHSEAAPRLAAEEAARAAEARFRAVFDNAGATMLLIGRDYRVVDANRAAARLTGLGPEELEGLSLGDLLHPDDVAHGAQLATRLFAGELREYRVEQRIATRRGTCLPVGVTTIPVGDTGHPSYALMTLERIRRPTAREAPRATATPF
jgi:PAS domain S-box-containing protein